MMNLGEFCKECLCSVCGYRKYCRIMECNTDWYCKEVCKGETGCMNQCSQFEREQEDEDGTQEN